MISEEAVLIRNKITGVLLRGARLHAKKSVQECAEALSSDPEFVVRAEEGEEGLTLPQLETLAHLLQVPLSDFLGEGELPPDQDHREPPPYENIRTLRRKIIGVLLRQARLEADRTPEDVTSRLSMTPERLEHVELGEERITLVELEELSKTLGLAFDDLISEDLMPPSLHEPDNHDLPQLGHLPSDIQAFIKEPINLPYLQIAMNLSQMPSDRLRLIASGLLEITY
jgi:transcriptional regulator with XRE-family HTH domain